MSISALVQNKRKAGERRSAPWILAAAILVASCAHAQDTSSASAAAASQPTVSAQQTPIPARLSDVEGQVRITRIPQTPAPSPDASQATLAPGQVPPPPPPDEVFRDARINMPVLAGMQIETGESGRAELQFNDGNLLRIAPSSAVLVVAIGSGGEQLRAVRGLSYYELPPAAFGVLNIQVGPDQLHLAANSLLRVDLDNVPFQAAVLRGAMHVSNQASDINFETVAGETATLDPAAANAYDIRQDLASNSWDAWNSDRDSELAEMAGNETSARVGNGAPGSDAWNDLDYYGTWYNVPGAGMAWAPDGVDAGFDPYGQGAWGYYSGVGYTWISGYPWGWLPYRCGGWNYFNSFGWVWQPGAGCGSYGWYPYTGVSGGPRGYQLPMRPLDPRLRTRLGGAPLPRAVPLSGVNRGPSFQFRQIGTARPQPRAFPVTNQAKASSADATPAYAAVLPLIAVQPGQLYRPAYGAFGGGAAVQGGRSGAGLDAGSTIFTPGAHAFSPAPHVLPAPRTSIPAAPVRMAPPPAALTPRVAAPPPAPAPARAH